MTPTLGIRHLSISFHQYERGLRRRTVNPVVDMSLAAFAGEVLAVVGASGAGKSLIGLAAMGLLPPNAEEHGTITFDGQPRTATGRRALAGHQMTLLPQSGTFLDPLARIGTQVRRAAALAGHRRPRTSAAAALARHGLPAAVMRQYPHQLSGGMVRRVLFAIATMTSPQLVFADEPTPGLHPTVAAEVIADIRGLADRGSAVILVSHDLDQVLPIADQVVVCHAGHTVEEATPTQFTGDGSGLQHPYSRALWRALPAHGFTVPHATLPDAAAPVSGVPPVRENPAPGGAAPPITVATNRHPGKVADRPRNPRVSPGAVSPDGTPLAATNLWFRYGTAWVLQGVNLQVKPGEVVGLQGPSGCGKSTLARVLTGDLAPLRGTVTGPPMRGRVRAAQLVRQHSLTAMNPRWKIRHVLGEATRDVSSVVGSLVLPTWLDAFPHELSGGELQRVNLARALLARPAFVVADEITASLDAITQVQLWDFLLDGAKRDGYGILAVSHDAALLAAVADRIVTMTDIT